MGKEERCKEYDVAQTSLGTLGDSTHVCSNTCFSPLAALSRDAGGCDCRQVALARRCVRMWRVVRGLQGIF